MRQCPYAKGTAFLKFSIDHLLDNPDGSLHPGTVQPCVVQECVQSIHLIPDITEDRPLMVSKAFIVLLHAVVLLFVVINVLHIRVDVALDLSRSSSPA